MASIPVVDPLIDLTEPRCTMASLDPAVARVLRALARGTGPLGRLWRHDAPSRARVDAHWQARDERHPRPKGGFTRHDPTMRRALTRQELRRLDEATAVAYDVLHYDRDPVRSVAILHTVSDLALRRFVTLFQSHLDAWATHAEGGKLHEWHLWTGRARRYVHLQVWNVRSRTLGDERARSIFDAVAPQHGVVGRFADTGRIDMHTGRVYALHNDDPTTRCQAPSGTIWSPYAGTEALCVGARNDQKRPTRHAELKPHILAPRCDRSIHPPWTRWAAGAPKWLGVSLPSGDLVMEPDLGP